MVFRILLVACLIILSSSVALALGENIPQRDDFQAYALGEQQPLYQGDTLWWNDSGAATEEAGVRYTVIEQDPTDPSNRVAHIVDHNTTSGKYTHLRTGFFFPTSVYLTSGAYDVFVDIRPLNTTGAFKIHLTDHNGWTTSTQWVTGVVFGSTVGTSNNTYTPGMTNGVANIGYETNIFSQVWVDSGFTYQADNWYTLRMAVDVDNKKYSVFIGDRGSSTMTELTPAGGIPWITDTRNGNTPQDLYGIIFGTSSAVNDSVDFMIDNVYITPEPSGLLALATGGLGLIGLLRRRRA